MASKLITCPESAHLEQIEYEDHPLGILIVACSRFKPSCAVTCARLCAARLDQKRRAQLDDVPTDPDELAVDVDSDVELSIELADITVG